MARTDFTVTLRPQPKVDPVRALRAALKVLLRRFGLRAIKIEEREAGEANAVSGQPRRS
jgi:hypothetical protein